MRIKATSHLVTLNHFDTDLGILKRQQALEKLVVESEHAGYWTLVAQIVPENEASLSLHTALGFNIVGTRTKLGRMGYGPFAGRWRDVIMLERRSHAIE
jgi:phosphinothricin acetyltransferase